MRTIQSQRETFARFIEAAPQFDWRRGPYNAQGLAEEGPNSEHFVDSWHAPLENGHQLEVLGLPNSPTRINDKPPGYAAWTNTEGGGKNPQYIHPPEDSTHFHFPSREHAMEAAEQAYRQKFPIGTDTGGHDSGVDYSDLNSFKDYL